MKKRTKNLRIAVIGTGFAGVCATIKLQEAGFSNITVLERAHEVGGTWRDNNYPGCACDVPAVLYSYSFAPNPDWSRMYCSHDELYAYLRRVTQQYDLRRLIRFGTEVAELRFDEVRTEWTVTTATGEKIVADVIVNGTGTLSQPAIPRLKGLEKFQGRAFHSANWDHDQDLTGKSVAVIGTGASAIQFVPKIADQTANLDVYQRTAPWVMPRDERNFSDAQKKTFRRFPGVQRLLRWQTYWDFEWLARGFLGKQKVVDAYRSQALSFIERSVPDLELRAKVTPHYDPGCKRRLISNEWYPALCRDDVALITEGIREIKENSIITSDGVERAADTIIFGTGFAATDFLSPMRVYGAGGRELTDVWKEGAATHLGVASVDFPNLFFVMGPNTALGHNSIVFMIESQVRYIVSALEHLNRIGGGLMRLKRSVQDKSYAEVQRRFKGTVWASGCSSWYLKEDGHNDTLWPATTVEYWWRTRRFSPSNFDLVAQSPQELAAAGTSHVGSSSLNHTD